MKFTKMQGIGNDYVYVNCFEETLKHPSEIAKFVSDRHFGIGSDGLILICPSEVADCKMVMYNADGTQSQMCGNGVRCVGKFVRDRGLTDKDVVTVETLAGIKVLNLHRKGNGVDTVTVDMGEPVLDCPRIPVNSTKAQFIEESVEVLGHTYGVTAVSMGNPHGVVFVEDTASLELPTLGSIFEHHPIFPERANTEFIQVINPTTLKMRVWERGAGETLACGTGACAALVAAVLTGRAERTATLQLLGGDLTITWDEETNHVFMTGPAAFVFDGEIDVGHIEGV